MFKLVSGTKHNSRLGLSRTDNLNYALGVSPKESMKNAKITTVKVSPIYHLYREEDSG